MSELDAYHRLNEMQYLNDDKIIRHPICIVPPEQHYESCNDLLNDIKRYEKTRAYFYQEHPEIKPPKGKFEVVKDCNGKGFILLPTSMDYGVLYRGQSDYYPKCLPTIYRNQLSEEELFAEQVKIAEFKLYLSQYDITKRFEKAKYNVDYIGLAQHYGLNTGVLDLTSDVEIALFFAMCDKDGDCYKPKTEDKEYIGYLYAIPANEGIKNQNNAFETFSDRIKVIGLQPFKRPGLQKGYAFHVGKEGLNNGYLYSFNYTKDDSERFYNKFKQGTALWCDDHITQYAEKIKGTKVLSHQAISLASRMFGHTTSTKKRCTQLKKLGYRIDSYRKQAWSGVNLPCDDIQWLNIQKDIVSRSIITENKKYPCINTKFIGEELIFNYMYGCTDCPEGYDSGFSYEEYTDAPIYGLCVDFAHKPLVPDEVDKKIHAAWERINSTAPTTRSFSLPDSFKYKLKKMQTN